MVADGYALPATRGGTAAAAAATGKAAGSTDFRVFTGKVGRPPVRTAAGHQVGARRCPTTPSLTESDRLDCLGRDRERQTRSEGRSDANAHQGTGTALHDRLRSANDRVRALAWVWKVQTSSTAALVDALRSPGRPVARGSGFCTRARHPRGAQPGTGSCLGPSAVMHRIQWRDMEEASRHLMSTCSAGKGAKSATAPSRQRCGLAGGRLSATRTQAEVAREPRLLARAGPVPVAPRC